MDNSDFRFILWVALGLSVHRRPIRTSPGACGAAPDACQRRRSMWGGAATTPPSDQTRKLVKRNVRLRPNQARHAQYPALDLRHSAVGRREVRLQQARERAVAVGPPEPG